jgi:cupin 2 domain-containing protein
MCGNLFENIPNALSDELFTLLAEGRGFRIERIVSAGHGSPEGFWYDQEQNEWVLLVSGSAVLSVEKDSGTEQIALKSGDYLLIPAHQRHRVESTSLTEKTIWLAIYFSNECRKNNE